MDDKLKPSSPPPQALALPQSSTKPKIDVVRIPTVEMLEYVIVETAFITKSTAQNMNFDENSYVTNFNTMPSTEQYIADNASPTPVSIPPNILQPMIKPTIIRFASSGNPTMQPTANPVSQFVRLSSPNVQVSSIRPMPPTIQSLTLPKASTSIQISTKALPIPSLPRVNNQYQYRSSNIPGRITIDHANNTNSIQNTETGTRDSCQQTDLVTMEKSIQCEIDTELSFEDDNIIDNTIESGNNELELFEQFVKEKSYVYPNGIEQCMKCSEMCTNSTNMKLHLASHWGPSVLCSKCGLVFENKRKMKRHKCNQPLKRQYLRCPDYRCRVIAISPLELYDHINEHINFKGYHCTICQKSFTTASELRLHKLPPCNSKNNIKIDLNSNIIRNYMTKSNAAMVGDLKFRSERICRSRMFVAYSLKRRRNVLLKTFLSVRSMRWARDRRCQICLKYCNSLRNLPKHIARCKRLLQRRMTKEHNTPKKHH